MTSSGQFMVETDNLSKTGFQVTFLKKIVERMTTVIDTLHNYDIAFDKSFEEGGDINADYRMFQVDVAEEEANTPEDEGLMGIGAWIGIATGVLFIGGLCFGMYKKRNGDGAVKFAKTEKKTEDGEESLNP